MIKKIKKILAFTLVGIMVISLSLTTLASEIDKAKDKKTSLEERKKETQKALNKLEEEKGDIVKYIDTLDKELSRLTNEIDELTLSVEEIEKVIEITEEELKAAKENEVNQYATMKQRIKFMYENGNSAYIDVLLDSESLSDLLNKSEYILKISEYDRNMLERYVKTKELVIEKEEEAKKVHQEHLEALEELDYEKAAAEELVNNKTIELKKYESDIGDSEVMLAEYQKDIEAQEKLIEEMIEQERIRQEQEAERIRLEKEAEKKRLAEEAAEKIRLAKEAEKKRLEEEEKARLAKEKEKEEKEQEEIVASTGDFIWPCPSSNRITSYFGNRDQPTEGASTNHKGIDIGAPTGTNIVASAGGTVIISTYATAAGNYIMISHGNGMYTVYMHCSKLIAKVGDTVSQGEVIALVGSTGVSTGPHLHFGIMEGSQYVDPLDYVN